MKGLFKKIVVAVNGHESSIHAAMYAILMAKTYNLELKAVYVVDTATIKYLSMNHFLISEESSSYEEQLNADGEKYLKYVERLAQTKGLKIQTELRSGGIFSEVVKVCEEFKADILLLGGHENKNGKKNIISEKESDILSNSKIPVMFVKNENIEKLFKL